MLSQRVLRRARVTPHLENECALGPGNRFFCMPSSCDQQLPQIFVFMFIPYSVYLLALF